MLHGKNINLRLVSSEDLSELMTLQQQISWNIDQFYPLQLFSELDWMANFDKDGMWATNEGTMLIENKQEQLVGEIDFFRSSPSVSGFELGFQIYRPEDRGKGYMSEAVQLFCAYLYASKNIERLCAHVVDKNIGAASVLERCGFSFEGTIRGAAFHRGQYLDYKLYSLLRNESPELETLLTA